MIFWGIPESNLTANAPITILCNELETYNLHLLPYLQGTNYLEYMQGHKDQPVPSPTQASVPQAHEITAPIS